jgi:recombination protein RecT
MTVVQQNLSEKAAQAIQRSANSSSIQKRASTLTLLKNLIDKDEVKKRFSEVLGKKAPQFAASIISLVGSATNFDDVDVNTVMSSAMVAATLDLPINQNLGFAYIIPYKGKAQFQMGYKGFIQLALRSGHFKTINATPVYEGEVVSLNRLTGEIELDEAKKKTETVIGFAAYFRLINGFEKTVYMTTDQIRDHGKKFSKSFNNENGLWKKDFHSMAMKTVLKLLLSKYAILSVEMERAIVVDQGVIKDDNTVEYVDAVSVDQDVIATSKANREGYQELIGKAADAEYLGKLRQEIVDLFGKGDLTETDHVELVALCEKRGKEIGDGSSN